MNKPITVEEMAEELGLPEGERKYIDLLNTWAEYLPETQFEFAGIAFYNREDAILKGVIYAETKYTGGVVKPIQHLYNIFTDALAEQKEATNPSGAFSAPDEY